ncbi:hypothetical protein CRYUN_Cryun29cG0063500 [Craigia yunnanensis]
MEIKSVVEMTLSALLALPKEDQLSDSEIVAVLWEMIFRGTDTVAILLEWIMARMVLHQDIQAKVQQEIDACIGSGERGSQDAPTGPTSLMGPPSNPQCPRGEVFRPAGTTAMVNMWAITHDPSIWNDPWTFRPERFVQEKDVSIMGSDLRLAPFGSGRRVRPGKALGLATVQLWLARLLNCFRWLPVAQHVDLSETLRLSLEMKKPLACQVVPRTAHHVS